MTTQTFALLAGLNVLSTLLGCHVSGPCRPVYTSGQATNKTKVTDWCIKHFSNIRENQTSIETLLIINIPINYIGQLAVKNL